jgi:membrane protease YdiL (CAAX protease family)
LEDSRPTDSSAASDADRQAWQSALDARAAELDARAAELDALATERSLHRYRAWQWLSIAAIVIGLLLSLSMLGFAQAALDDPQLRLERGTYLVLLLGGAALLLGGSLANIARSLIVRRGLPEGRYRGPSVMLLLLLAAAISVAASAVFTSDAVALTTGEGEITLVGSVVILTSTQVALLVVTALFVAWPRALPRWPLVPPEGMGRSILLGVGMAFPAWVLVSIVAALAATLLQRLGIQPEPEVSQQLINVANPVVAVIATVIVAPIAEETFFRGVAFTAWSREYGFRRAVIASALLFATIHGSLVALLPIFGLGVGLALLYHRTRSLPASIAMHATFNAISVALVLAERFNLIRLT